MNRTKLVLSNAVVVGAMTILEVFLGMFEVRVFLDAYGDQINGLMQTVKQMLTYLALIESGLCSAYLFRFYKPMAENDLPLASSLLKGFRISMRRIVMWMMVAAVLLSSLYPFIIKDKSILYFDMATIAILLSIRFIAPYFITMVPKYMIIVKEMKYIVELVDGLSVSLVFLVEIVVILLFKPPIQVVIVIGIIVTFITGLIYRLIYKRLYKDSLDTNAEPNFEPNKLQKDILAHNISGMVFNSTDSVILSAFSTLTNTFIYGVYNKVVHTATKLFRKISDGTQASLGIKLSTMESSSYSVFREILSGSNFLATLVTSVFIIMINPFIDLWIGSEYKLGMLDVTMFGFLIYSYFVFTSINIARNAKGLFKESRNLTIFQAVLNLAISLALVQKLGITGVLLGSVVARFLVTIPMNYKLVYGIIFTSEKARWWELVVNPAVTLLITIFGYKLIGIVGLLDGGVTWTGFIMQTVLVTLVVTILSAIYYLLSDKWFKLILKRLMNRQAIINKT